ncbi:TM1812 family CRISPR-associated protein [Streptococcus panodentis]|uniref:Uncharacterized protein n=1 Tax=Streptococcus panodentis TaxID=1581472 RepID=A0ABS5AZT4_9STRE|nr:TM1812 family CRISPR-associated protein [Streptococcus panodentis]MBP2621776.1 hypothetical protein [Streptococcus panodentis]
MVFVREDIPEEYWGMLKEKGLYNEYTYLDMWTADKEREIYLWMTRFPDRDDESADYVLLWKNQVIELNVTTTDTSQDEPIWDEHYKQILKKGIIRKKVNSIKIPESLVFEEIKLLEIINEVFQHTNKECEIIFDSIAKPVVR